MSRFIFKYFFVFLAYLAVSYSLWICFLTVEGGLTEDPRLSLPALLSRKADKLFVSRALAPVIVNSISDSINDDLFKTLEKFYWQKNVEKELDLAKLDISFAKKLFVVKCLTLLSFIVFGIALNILIEEFYHTKSAFSHGWSLFSVAILPIFFGPNNSIYDPFSLLLPCLLFLALYRQKLVIYYILFALCTLNRETSILFYMFFLSFCILKRYSFLYTVKHAIFHFLIYITIYIYIHILYFNNPGGIVENHFMHNVYFLITPSYNLLTFCLKFFSICFLILYKIKEKPPLLVKGLFLISLFLIPLWISFGRLSELREWFEVYFLICLLALPSLWKILDFSRHTTEPVKEVS